MSEEPPEVTIIGSRSLTPEEKDSLLKEVPIQQGEKIDVGWIDLVEGEAHSQSRKKDKVALPGAKETFESGVLENLQQEIRDLAKGGSDPKTIYRQLSFRYHPNFYAQKDQVTLGLATECSQALQKMLEIGYLEKLARQ